MPVCKAVQRQALFDLSSRTLIKQKGTGWLTSPANNPHYGTVRYRKLMGRQFQESFPDDRWELIPRAPLLPWEIGLWRVYSWIPVELCLSSLGRPSASIPLTRVLGNPAAPIYNDVNQDDFTFGLIIFRFLFRCERSHFKMSSFSLKMSSTFSFYFLPPPFLDAKLLPPQPHLLFSCASSHVQQC